MHTPGAARGVVIYVPNLREKGINMKVYIIEYGKFTGREYNIDGFVNINVSDGYNCKNRTKKEVENEVKEYGECILRCMTSGTLKIEVRYEDRTEIIHEGVYNSSGSGIIIK